MMATGQFMQHLRCLVDRQYRRAFRSLRHLPRMDYRVVVDAGASRGSFADAFLQLHRPVRLVLVEALPNLAVRLKERYGRHPGVSVVQAALSERTGQAAFEVNEFDYSSSLLKIDPRNDQWFGRSLKVASTIQVPTLSLGELMREERLERIDLLKLDLQGAEQLVLTGAGQALDRVAVLYTEVLFERLYAGCWLFWDINQFLVDRGFKLCGLSNIVHATAGDLLQANATFRPSDVTRKPSDS